MFGFHSPAVKACLDALTEIEAKHPDLRSLGIAGQVRSAITKQPEKAKHSLNNEGRSPHGIVWLLVTNFIAPELGLGHNHIYRGTLNMRGHAMLALWDHACEQMTSLGIHGTAEETKEKEYIRRQIANAG